ncbi:MAG: heparinase II/III family protein, partial [Bacilli bacterium]|nr:heparinase II/III family protein [Bacilli bacterium]
LPIFLNTDFDNFENISLIQETANHPMSNYGMLRNKYYNVFLKYGHNSPSHAHQDVMNLEVTLNNKFITRDISNAGYKSKMYREWHRNTPAHTTVVVDGLNQVSTHPGKTLIYNSNQICAKCIDVYPGVNYKRDIILNDKEMFDTFFVESKEVHNYDYFFHFESSLDLKHTGSFKLEELGFSEPGYEHLENAYKLIKTDNEYQFNLKNQSDEIKILIDLQDKELFILETYDNPVNKMRKTILIRSRGFNAVFKIQLRLI